MDEMTGRQEEDAVERDVEQEKDDAALEIQHACKLYLMKKLEKVSQKL